MRGLRSPAVAPHLIGTFADKAGNRVDAMTVR
jgi:hypothetical protein